MDSKPSNQRNKCELDVLPSDLYTREGGSKAYGGPQMAADGSIEFFGSSFAIPRGKDGEDVTEVRVTPKSEQSCTDLVEIV